MTKIISISKLSNSLTAGAGLAFVLAFTMMVGFQYAEASTLNITTSENMTVGSTGENVAVLQGVMSELGYLELPVGVSLGYYGPLTQSAVARYQVSRSVVPPAGYYGSITKVALHQDLGSRGLLTVLGW